MSGLDETGDTRLTLADVQDFESCHFGGGNPASPVGVSSRMSRLARTIEGEVIPRLMLAHRAPAPRARNQGNAPGQADIEALGDIVMRGDLTAALSFVDEFRKNGTALETIFLDLLAPTARRLGALWETDDVHFMDVTVGLCRLQQVLHELSPDFEAEGEQRETGPRVLLAPVPGEQHLLGILIVEEFCRRAGWDVWTAFSGSPRDIRDLVRSQHFDAVGLSMSSENSQVRLRDLVGLIRRESLNPSIVVTVGGRAFVADPELAVRVGADATAIDGRDAILQLQRLVRPAIGRDHGGAREGQRIDGELGFR
jgi:methanogenic corrinoid protein MtbC1